MNIHVCYCYSCIFLVPSHRNSLLSFVCECVLLSSLQNQRPLSLAKVVRFFFHSLFFLSNCGQSVPFRFCYLCFNPFPTHLLPPVSFSALRQPCVAIYYSPVNPITTVMCCRSFLSSTSDDKFRGPRRRLATVLADASSAVELRGLPQDDSWTGRRTVPFRSISTPFFAGLSIPGQLSTHLDPIN